MMMCFYFKNYPIMQHDFTDTNQSGHNRLNLHKFYLEDIHLALISGLATYRSMPGPSMAYAAIFVLIGLILLTFVILLGATPMVLPLIGGFMLIGPALLSGYFELARIRLDNNHPPELKDALNAFRHSPGGLWIVALFCAFLFLVWITDATILYALMIGDEKFNQLTSSRLLQDHVMAFSFWGSLMGAVLALIILSISAFSVPILFERRAGLVTAIHASTRAVLGNFASSLLWGLILSMTTLVSILLLPLLMLTMPVMAYTSFNLYRRVYPPHIQIRSGFSAEEKQSPTPKRSPRR